MRSHYNILLHRPLPSSTSLHQSAISFQKFEVRSAPKMSIAGQGEYKSLIHKKDSKKKEQKNSIAKVLRHEHGQPSQSYYSPKNNSRLSFKRRSHPPAKNFCQIISQQTDNFKKIFLLMEETLNNLKSSLSQIRKFIYEDIAVTLTNITEILGAHPNTRHSFIDSRILKVKKERSIGLQSDSTTEKLNMQSPAQMESKQSLLNMYGLNEIFKENKKCSTAKNSPHRPKDFQIIDESEEVLKIAQKYIESIKSITKKMAKSKTPKGSQMKQFGKQYQENILGKHQTAELFENDVPHQDSSTTCYGNE